MGTPPLVPLAPLGPVVRSPRDGDGVLSGCAHREVSIRQNREARDAVCRSHQRAATDAGCAALANQIEALARRIDDGSDVLLIGKVPPRGDLDQPLSAQQGKEATARAGRQSHVGADLAAGAHRAVG